MADARYLNPADRVAAAVGTLPPALPRLRHAPEPEEIRAWADDLVEQLTTALADIYRALNVIQGTL